MLTDPNDRRESGFVEHQPWLHLPGALYEQLNRAVVGQLRQALQRGRSVRIFWWEVEPVDVEQPFSLEVQALARGEEQGDMRRALEDGGEQIGARQQVLEVVEHEQHVALAQIAEQVCGGVSLPGK